MAFIPLPDPAGMSDTQREVYERFPANLVRGMLCATLEVADAYERLATVFPKASLEPKLREMTILRVAAVSGSAYERMQHIDSAHSAGVTDAEVAALESGRYDELTNQEAAVLRFVDELIDTPKAATTRKAALQTLGDVNLATLTVLVGCYMMTARFVETLDIELDDAPTSWDNT
ncbi:carboxymuconolactone decarboxylase family protein [Rhodococcus sp. NPDC058521]|uniref:carboxymuconolactone decarboxylase family protein n=1 Tax=Rhodococcus sp. NPDC058521 TaxID=3346536 RepID=UPI0036534907